MRATGTRVDVADHPWPRGPVGDPERVGDGWPAEGMESRVVSVVDGAGARIGAASRRTLRSTGQTVYSGWYNTVLLVGARRRSVRVVFPLPNGSLVVLLRPELERDGALNGVRRLPVRFTPSGPRGEAGPDPPYARRPPRQRRITALVVSEDTDEESRDAAEHHPVIVTAP